VIAEGVEKTDEAQVLGDLGVGLVQGFHFGYPSLPSELNDQIRTGNHPV
jgi:EAL domain-containing protein (putative c-di-GMP-specific phosphodiesterase class I)